MRVRDVMIMPAVSVAADAPLVVARALLRHHGLTHLPVTERGEVVGLVSGAKLRRLLHGSAGRPRARRWVADYATVPAVTVDADDTLDVAWERMRRHGLGCAPVVVNGTLVGLLTDRALGAAA